MGSMTVRQKFDPWDLEIIDRVYEVACAYIEARDLYLDTEKDAEEQDALRKRVFAFADTEPLDFDALCDNVLASINGYRRHSQRPSPDSEVSDPHPQTWHAEKRTKRKEGDKQKAGDRDWTVSSAQEGQKGRQEEEFIHES
jgi:hypothetical protein